MDRSKSFRFFGVTPKSDGRDSQGDVDDEQRTASIGQKQQRQRSTRALQVQSAEAKLRAMYLSVPKDLDVVAMRDLSGCSPLHAAALRGHVAAAEHLLAGRPVDVGG